MLIVLGTVIAAIVIGGGLYYYGPAELREMPAAESSEASALGADQATDVPFTVIAEGPDAADASERKNYAVFDEEELDRLWAMAYGEGAPAMPAIDFEKEYVIGVFAGQKSSGGHSIAVEDVSDEKALRYVSIVLTTPGSGCVSTQALTSPFQIITVPFSDRELARVEKEAIALCS
jgi:hypothetical protein